MVIYVADSVVTDEGMKQEVDEKTLEECRKAVECNPDDASAWRELSRYYYREEENEKGDEALDKAVELAATQGEVKLLVSIASSLQHSGTPEKCFNAYKEAIKADPDNPQIWLYLAVAYSDNGYSSEAVTTCDKVLELKPNQEILYSAMLNKGNEYNKMEDFDAAIETLREASLVSDSICAFEDLHEAYIGKTEKEFLDFYLKRVELNESDPAEWYRLGLAYMEVGNAEKAIQAFEKSQSMGHVTVDIWRYMHTMYMEVKNYQKAIESGVKSLELCPDEFFPWANMCDACEALGDYQQLFELCEKFPRNNNTVFYTVMTLLKKADADQENGKLDNAIQTIRQTIELDPENRFLWKKLGDVYADCRQVNDALGAYQKAIEYDQKDVQTLAWNKKRRPADEPVNISAEAFDKAIRIAPDDTFLWETLDKFNPEAWEQKEARSFYSRLSGLDEKFAERFNQVVLSQI